MTVFKACYKIMKKNFLTLVIYTAIFIGISSMSSAGRSNTATSFKSSTVRTTVINQDKDGKLAKALTDYIAANTDDAEIVESDIGIQDALFYRITEYVITIPKGFSEDFEQGKEVKLPKNEIAGSFSGMFVDSMIDNYLNTAKLYMAGNETDINEIIKLTNDNMKISTDVELSSENITEVNEHSMYHYNFAAYPVMALGIFGVSSLLVTFNATDLKKRNIVSPIKPIKLNIIQVVSNAMFMIVIWGINMLSGVLVVGKDVLNINLLFIGINMLALIIATVAFAYMISTLIKSDNGIQAVGNTFSLGCAFLGGCFVPMSMLGSVASKIGSFTPTYWYVKTNEAIHRLSDHSLSSMSDIWKWMGIELLFALAFMSVGLVIAKQKTSGDR